MKLNFFKVITTLILLLSTHCAHAAISCSITSTGFTTGYTPNGIFPNVTQGSFVISCSRNSGDPTTMNYSVAVDNGINGTNNAEYVANANRIRYETYRNSGCSTVWGSGAGSRITGTVNVPSTTTVNYWGCITVNNQNKIAGTYTDTITMTLRNTDAGSIIDTGSFPVTINNPATCSILNIDPVAFGTYTAFSATDLVAPVANIKLNCTLGLPFNLALDATSGVIVGLNYSLALSKSSSRGTGPPSQIETITGTMPRNQVGTCATATCNGAQTRTLTISY